MSLTALQVAPAGCAAAHTPCDKKWFTPTDRQWRPDSPALSLTGKKIFIKAKQSRRLKIELNSDISSCCGIFLRWSRQIWFDMTNHCIWFQVTFFSFCLPLFSVTVHCGHCASPICQPHTIRHPHTFFGDILTFPKESAKKDRQERDADWETTVTFQLMFAWLAPLRQGYEWVHLLLWN